MKIIRFTSGVANKSNLCNDISLFYGRTEKNSMAIIYQELTFYFVRLQRFLSLKHEDLTLEGYLQK